jgi:hypothetical protein
MSILTIDTTGTPITLAVQKAGHAEPRQVGARWYTFSGKEKRSIRAELMVVPVIIVHTADFPTDQTTMAAIRALFALGATVYCNGVVFNNGLVDVLCSGEITDEMEVGTSPANWIANLTLTEVENVGTSL